MHDLDCLNEDDECQMLTAQKLRTGSGIMNLP